MVSAVNPAERIMRPRGAPRLADTRPQHRLTTNTPPTNYPPVPPCLGCFRLKGGECRPAAVCLPVSSGPH